MFSIENSETRKSLKSVFENIFAKYGREFEEDDEIDLMSLEITKPRGHLARIKPLHFGNAFKRKSTVATTSLDISMGINGGDDVFESNNKQFHPEEDTQKASQLHSNLVRAIADSSSMSSRNANVEAELSSTKVKRRKSRNFDSILRGIIREEHSFLIQFEPLHSSDCFDCILFGAQI